MKLNLRSISLALVALVCLLPWTVRSSDVEEGLVLARKLNAAFVNAIDTVVPSVVIIAVRSSTEQLEAELERSPLFRNLPDEEKEEFRSRMEEQREERRRREELDGLPVTGNGSGVIIREDGFILTNRHVIEGAQEVSVTLHDGTELDATVHGEDPRSDLAILKVDATGLPAARFAMMANVHVGEFAFAVGAPFSLDYSATFGHVSAIGRTQVLTGMIGSGMDQDFVQTDAGINPGNSGGPLINIEGEVIGINTLIRGMNTGIGFAINSDLVQEVAERLINEGRYVRGYLGVRIQTLSEAAEREFIRGVEEGVLVFGIPASGPAADSDLRPGDVIISVNDETVISAAELKAVIRVKRAGEVVRLSVVRGGRPESIEVTLGEFPDLLQAGQPLNREIPREPRTASAFGVQVGEISDGNTEGVAVLGVDEGSVAAYRGIRVGDVVTTIGGERVESIGDFERVTAELDLKKGVIVILENSSGSRFVTLREIGE